MDLINLNAMQFKNDYVMFIILLFIKLNTPVQATETK